MDSFPQSPQQRPRTSLRPEQQEENRKQLERLLVGIETACDPQSHLLAIGNLRDELRRQEQGQQEQDVLFQDEVDDAGRVEFIVKLLQTVVTSNILEEQTLYESVIISSNSLSIVVRGLLETLESSSSSLSDSGVPPTALDNTLAVLEMVLFYETKKKHSEKIVSSPPLYLAVSKQQGFAVALVQNNANSTHDQNMIDFFQEWVNLLLRVPRWISNAFLKRKHSIPVLWTVDRYLDMWLQKSTREAILEQKEQQQQQKQQNNSDNTLSCCKWPRSYWWSSWVGTVIRQQGADHVAQAFWNVQQQQQTQNENNHWSFCWKQALLFLCMNKQITPREIALLCRSLLYLAQAKRWKRPQNNDSYQANDWMNLVMETILGFSHQIQEAVVRTCILSSNDYAKGPGIATALAQYLAMCTKDHCPPQNANSNRIDADDDDDNDDEEILPSQMSSSSLTPLLLQMNAVASVWSNVVFVRQTHPMAQAHVTEFLVAGLETLCQDSTSEVPDDNPAFVVLPLMEDQQGLLGSLLEGTTLRLESYMQTSLRRDGIRVAKTLAKLMGKGDLDFGDEEGKIDSSEDQNLVIANDVDDDTKVWTAKSRVAERRRRRQKRLSHLDPDDEYNDSEDDTDDDDSHPKGSGDDDDDDSVWDDAGLETYDLSDDQEDIQETPRPLFLRQALELLQTPETEECARSCHEVALRELPALIRSRPCDLPLVAVDLAMQILHQENKFNLDNFSENKHDCLCALVASEPYAVGMAFSSEMFGSCSLMTRLFVLSALQEGAQELSLGFIPRLEEGRQRRTNFMEYIQRVYGKHGLVGEEKADGAPSSGGEHQTITTRESKTRRWGRGRIRKSDDDQIESTALSVQSQFGNIAPVWFYTLVGNFVERRDDETLWSGTIGATLLSQFFLTLGTILDLTTKSTVTTSMARDLVDLAWGFCREAEIAEVRKAALCALASSLSSLPDRDVATLLLQEQPDGNAGLYLSRGLLDMGRSDPDPDCRLMATLISTQIQDAIQNTRSIRMFFDHNS